MSFLGYYSSTLCRIIRDIIGWLLGWIYAQLFQLCVKYPRPIEPITDPLLLEPAVELVKKIKSRQLTCERLMNAYIQRIKIVNPSINAIVDDRFEDALADARRLDAEISAGNVDFKTKSLLGIPFTAKDSVRIEGLAITEAVYFRKGEKAEYDAKPVAHLKEAGAIPVAVTNVPQSCMWYSTRNRLYGTCRNPYDPNRITGGSSGGEGALLASAGTLVGVGSDLAGSVRIPSNFCGVWGHKPSPYLTDSSSLSFGQGRENIFVIGPLTRYACDLLPMLKAMADPDMKSKLQLDEPVDLKQVKVHYMTSFPNDPWLTPVDIDIQIAVKKAAAYLQECGCQVSGEAKLKNLDDGLFKDLVIANNIKGQHTIEQCFTGLKADKINLGREWLKWLVDRLFLTSFSKYTYAALYMTTMVRLSPAVEHPWNKRTVKESEQLRKDYEKLLGDDGVLLCPSYSEVPPRFVEENFKSNNISYTAIFNMLEAPVTQVPVTLKRVGKFAIPIGIQVASKRNNDRLTIAVANELNNLFGGWKPPCPVSL